MSDHFVNVILTLFRNDIYLKNSLCQKTEKLNFKNHLFSAPPIKKDILNT